VRKERITYYHITSCGESDEFISIVIRGFVQLLQAVTEYIFKRISSHSIISTYKEPN